MTTSAPEPLIKVELCVWLATGRKLFGDDPMLWRFVCPACKHVQSGRRLVEVALLAPEMAQAAAYMNCEGRYVEVAKGAKQPCDWTLGGLFRIHSVAVVHPDSKLLRPVFAFDHPDALDLLRSTPFVRARAVTHAPAAWTTWAWPEWVPTSVRAMVEERWSREGPAGWIAEIQREDLPDLGEEVKIQARDGAAEGRFVFISGSQAMVVGHDGTARRAWV